MLFIAKSSPGSRSKKILKFVKSGQSSTLPRVPFLPSGRHSAVDLPTASRASPGTGGASRHAAPLGQRRPRSSRWSWTRRTAMEPSPAAAVTRFTDPLRTSPAPKTPGWRRERALPDPHRQPAPWRPWPRSPSAAPGRAVRLTLASPAQGHLRAGLVEQTPAGPPPEPTKPRSTV
jgi:hypothetical protein